MRFALLYAALYAAFGVVSPFLPAFLERRGLPAEEIATVLAANTAIRLVSAPLAGRFADRYRLWSRLLAGCAAAAGACALLFLVGRGFPALLVVAVAQASLLAPLAPLSDALAVTASETGQGGSSRPNFRYGWVRGIGSAAFILGSLLAGHLAGPLGLSVTIWLNALLLGAAALCALPVPNITKRPQEPDRERGELWALLKLPPFLRLMLAAGLILGSHALHDSFAVIIWSDARIDTATSSFIWSESVAAEVVVFCLVGPAILERLGPGGCAALAAAAGVLRWGIMGTSTAVIALALVEPLHGLTFALFHLAAMRVIAQSVPTRLAATAQAVYGTVAIGVSTALLTLASGWLYANFSSRGFWVMAALCAIAMPIAVRLGGAQLSNSEATGSDAARLR